MFKCRKLLAFLLVLVLAIGVVPFTASAKTAQTIKRGYIFETGVNIREDATTTSAVVSNVSKIYVDVLGSKDDTLSRINPQTQKPYVWYNISYTANSKNIIGYVREDLINVTEYTLDPSFKEKLSDFPESYHESLTLLHAIYPNWNFVADKVPTTFDTAVAAQDTEFRKLVETGYNSWRSMREGCYDFKNNKFITTDGGRYGASREVIAYYMDPRNFLNTSDIYVFMQQSYDYKTQTVEGIENIVKGTFLDGTITDKNDKYYGKRYAAVIRYAGSQSKVNAYVLAATMIQEHGTDGSTLSNGTAYNKKTVYNHFNYKASGTTSEDIIKNGSKYAYEQGWFTPTRSIVGGATKYGSGYIAIGQDTYFYKNYNVLNPENLWHQYAQNVADSVSSSTRLRTTYSELTDMKLTFRIPVYEELPIKISTLPEKDDKYNNYYFEKLEVEGLTSFNRHKTNYSIKANGDLTLSYKVPNGATYQGASSYKLKKGENTVKLTVKSETGYTRTYTLQITAEKDATLNMINIAGTLIKESDGNWYYYVDDVKTKATTLVKYNDKWFYIKDGVWVKDTLLFKYNGKWFYIEKGKWNNTATTMFKFNGVWFYINKGKWDNTAKTLTKYQNKWFYIKGGKWDKDTLIFKYNGKDFYIKSGIAQLDFSGTKTIDGVKYKIKNGKVV